MKLAEDEADLVRTMMDLSPAHLYADRLARRDAPAQFLVTPNLQRLLGQRPADVGELYDRLEALADPWHRDRVGLARERAAARQPVLIEVQLRDAEDRLRWWRIRTEARADGLMVGILLEVTESVESSLSEQRARAEAEKSRDRALAANQAKTVFLSRMSHELRTPLNSIVGFGQLLELQELDDAEREWVDNVVLAGRHLLTLVDEVLDVVGIESGRLEVSEEAVDLVEVVEEVIGLLRTVADERGVAVQHREPEGRVWATGDHRRIHQILLHLVDNAVRYVQEGGSVTIIVEAAGERAAVVVADTGPGLSEDQVERAFQPFDRLGVEREGIVGTGMGLPLARSLAEHMGGSLAMSSAVASGTTLRLDLPAAIPPAVGPHIDGGDAVDLDRGDDRLTILYIEDNVANVRLMESVMELRPTVTLLTALRGVLGFEIARDQHPDLILVDLHLPDVDGREVVRMLRDEPTTAELPVAVVSADAMPGRSDEILALGADHYLTKPIDVQELITLVDDRIERKRERRGRAG